MMYKLRLPLHLQPLHQPQHEVHPYPNVLSSGPHQHAKRRNPCTGARTSECTRGLENSVVYHRTNNPGALNVKASVRTREHDSFREYCTSREPPGYYFGKRVLLPECSCRWPWSDVLFAWTSPRGCIIKKGMLGFLSEDKTLCTTRNFYWSKQNKTEKPSDEPPTDQGHRPGVRADQAHRARLIARTTISYGYLSLVKSVYVVFFFLNSSILK